MLEVCFVRTESQGNAISEKIYCQGYLQTVYFDWCVNYTYDNIYDSTWAHLSLRRHTATTWYTSNMAAKTIVYCFCFAEQEQRTLYGALAVTLSMLLRLINCRFIIIYCCYYYYTPLSRRQKHSFKVNPRDFYRHPRLQNPEIDVRVIDRGLPAGFGELYRVLVTDDAKRRGPDRRGSHRIWRPRLKKYGPGHDSVTCRPDPDPNGVARRRAAFAAAAPPCGWVMNPRRVGSRTGRMNEWMNGWIDGWSNTVVACVPIW